MRAIVKVVKHDTEMSFVPIQVLKDWVQQLQKLCFEDVVFLARDPTKHPEFWELCDYAEEKMLNVSYTTVDGGILNDYNEAWGRNVSTIVLSDFENPYEDEIIGTRNVGQKLQSALMHSYDVRLWVSLSKYNEQAVSNYIEEPYLSVSVFPSSSPSAIPFEEIRDEYGSLVDYQRDIDQMLVGPRVVSHLEQPNSIGQQLQQSFRETVGTMYVDGGGVCRYPKVISDERIEENHILQLERASDFRDRCEEHFMERISNEHEKD